MEMAHRGASNVKMGAQQECDQHGDHPPARAPKCDQLQAMSSPWFCDLNQNQPPLFPSTTAQAEHNQDSEQNDVHPGQVSQPGAESFNCFGTIS